MLGDVCLLSGWFVVLLAHTVVPAEMLFISWTHVGPRVFTIWSFCVVFGPCVGPRVFPTGLFVFVGPRVFTIWLFLLVFGPYVGPRVFTTFWFFIG
jgi:hypothetical protein